MEQRRTRPRKVHVTPAHLEQCGWLAVADFASSSGRVGGLREQISLLTKEATLEKQYGTYLILFIVLIYHRSCRLVRR